jgi:hypothetical protein
MPIEVSCRKCGRRVTPDRAAIVAGRWQLCLDCRDQAAPPNGVTICPHCGKVLQSDKHRKPCPGRRRRRRTGERIMLVAEGGSPCRT